MYPLRIFKQILCMFMSTMHPEFLDAYPELREFILNKDSNNFDTTKFRISMYILKEPRNGWSGLNVMLYNSGTTKTVAYIDIYPVGYILEIDPQADMFEYVSDISKMATDFTYDDKVMLGITLNVLERNTFWVGDFRSKEEIIKQSKESKLDTIKIVNAQMKELNIQESKYKDIVEEYLKNKINSAEFFSKIEKIKGEI